LDFQGALELRFQLAKPVGMMILPASVILDCPSVDALVSYLEAQLNFVETDLANLFEQLMSQMKAIQLQQMYQIPAQRPISRASTSRKQQKAALHSHVVNVVTDVLGTTVEHGAPLIDAGLDSFGASEMRVQLAKLVGMVMLPASLLLDYPSLDSIVGYLETHIAPEEDRLRTSLVKDTSQKEKTHSLRALVMDQVTNVLGAPVGSADSLMDVGLDSFGVSELRVQLANCVGMVMLPASLILDYPSVDALVGFLATHLDSTDAMDSETASLPGSTQSSSSFRSAADELESMHSVEMVDPAQRDGSATTSNTPPGGRRQLSNLHSFEHLLKQALAKVLVASWPQMHVLQHSWPTCFDDIHLSKLGFTTDMLKEIQAQVHLGLDRTTTLSLQDTVCAILARQKGHKKNKILNIRM